MHRLSWLAACGIFPDQGSILCPLHLEVNSYPRYHREIQGFLKKEQNEPKERGAWRAGSFDKKPQEVFTEPKKLGSGSLTA